MARLGRPPKPVSDRLRQAVVDSGMTHLQIANAAGVVPSSVGRFVSAKTDVRLATAERIAAAIGYRLELKPEDK